MGKAARSLEETLELLRERGLKRTQARRAILELMVLQSEPMSPEEVYAQLKGHGCDLVTVFRNLLSLEKAGLLGRFDLGDRVTRYGLVGFEVSSYAVTCVRCGSSFTFADALPKKLLESLKKKGFQEVSCSFDIRAVCATCVNRRSRSHPLKGVHSSVLPNS